MHDLSKLKKYVLSMSDEEKNMFLRDFRAAKGWSIEDEQYAIDIVKKSGLDSKLRNAVNNLQELLNESRNR